MEFEIDERVMIIETQEYGIVYGRCEKKNTVNFYLIFYTDNNGCRQHRWMPVFELKKYKGVKSGMGVNHNCR